MPGSNRNPEFQPADVAWEHYAAQEGLRSVLDPADSVGRKNSAIDLLHATAVADALGDGPLGSVLDFGCGTGRMVRHLAPRARRLIGVDITGSMLRRAKSETSDTDAPHAHWSRIDGLRLPLRDASIDCIVSVYVLQYAVRSPDSYAAVLDELARVLAPGGRLVCIEQVAAHETGSGSVGRAASCEDYLAPARGRFATLDSYPVRLARPATFDQRTLLTRDLPGPLRRMAARVSLARTARLDAAALAGQPYVDWLFRLESAPAQT